MTSRSNQEAEQAGTADYPMWWLSVNVHLIQAESQLETIAWEEARPIARPADCPDGIPGLDVLQGAALTPAYTELIAPWILHWSSIVCALDKKISKAADGANSQLEACAAARASLAKAGGYLLAIGMQSAVEEDRETPLARAKALATCGMVPLVGTAEVRPLLGALAQVAQPVFGNLLWCVGAQFLSLLQSDLQAKVHHKGEPRLVADLLSEPLLPVVQSRGLLAAASEKGDMTLPLGCAFILLTRLVGPFDLSSLAAALGAVAIGAQIQSSLGDEATSRTLAGQFDQMAAMIMKLVPIDADDREAVADRVAAMSLIGWHPEFTLNASGIGHEPLLTSRRSLEPAGASPTALLQVAIKLGQVQVAEALVDSGRIDLHQRLGHGETWLHLAAVHNLPYLVMALRRRGIPAESTDARGRTPFDVASAAGATLAAAVLRA